MSFFSSPADKYSPLEHAVPEHDIRLLINHEHVATLETHEQAELIADAIVARRLGDGKISLRQIFEVLEHLVLTYKISKFDRDGVMKVMQEYFAAHGFTK